MNNLIKVAYMKLLFKNFDCIKTPDKMGEELYIILGNCYHPTMYFVSVKEWDEFLDKYSI